jgi:hypothetical protein
MKQYLLVIAKAQRNLIAYCFKAQENQRFSASLFQLNSTELNFIKDKVLAP